MTIEVSVKISRTMKSATITKGVDLKSMIHAETPKEMRVLILAGVKEALDGVVPEEVTVDDFPPLDYL